MSLSMTGSQQEYSKLGLTVLPGHSLAYVKGQHMDVVCFMLAKCDNTAAG